MKKDESRRINDPGSFHNALEDVFLELIWKTGKLIKLSKFFYYEDFEFDETSYLEIACRKISNFF